MRPVSCVTGQREPAIHLPSAQQKRPLSSTPHADARRPKTRNMDDASHFCRASGSPARSRCGTSGLRKSPGPSLRGSEPGCGRARRVRPSTRCVVSATTTAAEAKYLPTTRNERRPSQSISANAQAFSPVKVDSMLFVTSIKAGIKATRPRTGAGHNSTKLAYVDRRRSPSRST